MEGKIKASGSVTSLTDEMGSNPDVQLTANCYMGMFVGCKSLETAPELPAKELASECYKEMFRECTSLKTAPKLPATSLAWRCYAYMFYYCSELNINTISNEAHSLPWVIANTGTGSDINSEIYMMFTGAWNVDFGNGYGQSAPKAGTVYYTGCDHDYGSDNKCKICGWEKPATEINTVDITISAPIPNDSFNTSATCSTTGVASASSITWTKADDTAVSENEKAQYGTEYYANITLTAADGYVFTNTTAVKCNSKSYDGTAVTLNDDGTLTVKIPFTTAKAKLLGITKPQQNVNVGFGAAKTAEGLGLPETVAVETELSEVTSADIEWNLDDVNYDKTKYEEQTFDVTGTIVLPETIDSNGIDLSVKLSVTVSAAKKISYTATGYTGTYDGKTHGITVNVTDPADATIMYSLNQVTGAKNEFKDAGTYKLYYYINKEGYEPVWGTCDIVINPKPIEASVNVENKTYDGTTDATVSAEINTGIDGEKLIVSGVTGSFADANAGENKQVNINSTNAVIKADQTASDTKTTNYAVTYPKTATADITPKPVNLQWSDTSLTYNGQDQIPKAEVDKSGIIGDDTVNVTVTGAKKDAGNNYTATASLTNDNYMIGKGSTQSFSIAPKKITVKADDKEKHAGKADPEFTYIVKDNGLVSGDELKDIQFTRNGGENAGNYDICIVVPDGSNPNYDIASESGTLTVNDHTYSAAAYTWSDDNAECTAVKKCTECDEQITETVKAKITEVQKVSCTLPEIKSFEAAFTKAGFTKQVKENVQTAEALGHKWDDGVITKEPTYTADGEKKFTCTNCNETRTEVIKKLFDNEAPKVEISCAANKWNQFLNTITFGHFFKETKEVSITASDDQTKNPEIWYFVSDKVCSEAEIKSDDISWIKYTGKVSLQKNSRNIIYAKAIDDAGNITVVNSDGIVIYTDSVETGSVSFNRLQTEDVKTDVTVNGNTVSKIMIGDTEVKAEDISKAVEIKNDTLVFKADYLNTIRPGTYTVTISYNPMGEKYVGNDKNDAPKDSVITLTVNRIKGELTVDAKALNKTYDGTAAIDPVISTKNDTADGKVKYEYKQRYADDSTYTTTAPKDAGEYTVKATVAADYTYTEAVAYADFTISKKTVDIIWSDVDFTFNGKEQKPTAAVADKDICKGDTADVAVSVSDGGIVAGEHKAQAHIENSNYVISTTDQETFTYTIKPKKITLTANDKVKHVGDKNPVFDYTAEGLVEGYTDLVNIGTRVEKGESVGTYKIFVEEISTGVNPNYDITTVPGTLTIADHTYADTTYTWNDDNTECTAARKCTFCDKTDTETAESNAEVTQEKTCTLPELTKYTVTFKNDNGTDFADQVKENVQTAEATGHKWDSGVQSKAPTYTEEGEMLYTCETCGETKTEVIEKLKLNEYDILEGADGTHVLKEDGSYSVRVNCAIEYFVAVQIDGKTVDSSGYTVERGSTIVTFTKEFMDSLSVGDHEVKFIFTNGTAKAAIMVVEKTQDTKQDTVDKSSSSTDTKTVTTTPKASATQQKKAAKSGDENPAMWVLFLMMSSGAGAATYGCKRKKAR